MRFSDAVDLRLSTGLVATDYVVPRDLLRSWPHKPWAFTGSRIDAGHQSNDGGSWLMQIGTWTSPLHSQDHFNAPDDAVGFMQISGANIQHEALGVRSPMEFWSGDVCERLALISSPLANRHLFSMGCQRLALEQGPSLPSTLIPKHGSSSFVKSGRLQVKELQLIVEMRPPTADPPGGGVPILHCITWHYLRDAS